MSDVSGRIWAEVLRAIHADPRTGSIEERVAYRDGNAAKATDRILAVIRDALLSDAPVTAATRIVEPTEFPWPSARARSAILAALDAITNGGDGHE